MIKFISKRHKYTHNTNKMMKARLDATRSVICMAVVQQNGNHFSTKT